MRLAAQVSNLESDLKNWQAWAVRLSDVVVQLLLAMDDLDDLEGVRSIRDAEEDAGNVYARYCGFEQGEVLYGDFDPHSIREYIKGEEWDQSRH
jgi:hypothetical protein